MKTKKREKLTDEEKFIVYDMAKDGARSSAILDTLSLNNVNTGKIKQEIKKIVKTVAEKRLNIINNKDSLKNYIYGVLPEECRELWDRLESVNSNSIGHVASPEMIEAILQGKGKLIKQQLFLQAMISTCYNLTQACKMLNITTNQVKIWAKDEDFRRLLAEVQYHKKNFFESSLIRLVASGDSAATIFVNKTLNRDRGYAEKINIDHKHEHTHVTVDDLQLPLEVRKTILKAMQEKQKMIPAGNDIEDAEIII